MSEIPRGRRLGAVARFMRRALETARHRLPRGPSAIDGATYADWVARYDSLDARTVAALVEEAGSLSLRPRLSLLLPLCSGDAARLEPTLVSVRDQIYPEWELCIAVAASVQTAVAAQVALVLGDDARVRLAVETDTAPPAMVVDATLRLATGTLCATLEAGDVLGPHALLLVAGECLAHPEAALVYSDEDEIDESGARRSPRFKPDFNLELLLSSAYIGRLAFFSTRRVRDLGGVGHGLDHSMDDGRHAVAGDTDAALPAAREFDLLLRIVETVPDVLIRHVPRVLYHRRHLPPPQGANAHQGEALSAETRAVIVRRHLDRRGISARVAASAEWPAGLRITYHLPQTPAHVTIIIPTRNAPGLLRACLEPLLAKTRYAAYDILVVDNGSGAAATVEELAPLHGSVRITVIGDARPFNWAAINNAAAARSGGDLLCLLNNDVEVLTPDWLEVMAGHALQPTVGAVGARLWYPGDTLQHAGLVLVPDVGATHLHQHLPRGRSGYLGRAVLAQNVSAVTGACLVVRRAVFTEAGGLDEGFPIDFNDVDFCLRLIARGYRNVWTPDAELRHHEAATRGPYKAKANRQHFERARVTFLNRWGSLVEHDAAFNPNLSPTNAEPPLAWPPRLPRLGS